jgi:D-xylose transport system ATP-binding protein
VGRTGQASRTLIKVLGGLHPASSYEGALYVDGAVARFRSVRDAEGAGIAVIHQELALVEEMTVAENVFLGDEPRRGLLVDADKMHSEAARLFRRFGIDIDVRTPVRTLGIGRRQLVEIVKALRKRSRVIVFDEPTAALADQEIAALLGILRDLRARGIASVYISHKLGEVLEIADRITVLRDGRSIVTLKARGATQDELIRHMVGREIRDLFPRRGSRVGEPLLRVEDLDVAADGAGPLVLRGISFEARAGEVVGIGGLMGAGRTELLMHLFGVWGRRRRGRVLVAERLLEPGAPRAAMAAGMVLVTEDRKRFGLVLDKSVAYNLSLSVIGRFAPHGIIDEPAEQRGIRPLFEHLRIRARDVEAPVRALSGGNQQKVVLGKALVVGPQVVLLDEPTRGIDVGAKVDVYELVNQLTAEGKAVVLVSSELPELTHMSDRLLVLHEGAVSGTFDTPAVAPEAVLAAAMGYRSGQLAASTAALADGAASERRESP